MENTGFNLDFMFSDDDSLDLSNISSLTENDIEKEMSQDFTEFCDGILDFVENGEDLQFDIEDF